jgi:hypothetical protein
MAGLKKSASLYASPLADIPFVSFLSTDHSKEIAHLCASLEGGRTSSYGGYSTPLGVGCQ